MGDPAPVTSPAKGKAQKKKSVSKKAVTTHPKYIDMITDAIKGLKARSGSSRQAIKKYVQSNNTVSDNFENPLKLALRKGVQSGALKQVKGTGASGSFKVADIKKVAKKKPSKTGAAKKAGKKSKSAKKPAAKKPAAKKPAAKKTPVKKPAAKKPAAKKPVAKKPAAKKVVKKKTPKKVSKKAKK